jgi:uncharacterized protein (TIGR00255 family)
MTLSMTGFASTEGALPGWSWSWDLRSVNGRGLDLRLRMPDWIDGLEAEVRKALQSAIGRGNVTLSLKLSRESSAGGGEVNSQGLAQAIALVEQVTREAKGAKLKLRKISATDLLGMRGVMDVSASDEDTAALKAALLADVPGLLTAFNDNRRQEGTALAALLAGQVDRVDALATEARALLATRAEAQAEALKASLERVAGQTDVDPQRVAQELAVLAVKSDVTEELDRLDAHVAAARGLLSGNGPRGRKLDFLTQEFNREANTLCAKAQFTELTRIGLDLKHTIDQMREQVQNVE